MQTPSLLAVLPLLAGRQAAAAARRAGAGVGLSIPAAAGESPADAGGRADAHHSGGRPGARADRGGHGLPRLGGLRRGARPASGARDARLPGGHVRAPRGRQRRSAGRQWRRARPGCAVRMPVRSSPPALAARGFREPAKAAQLLVDFRGAGTLRRLDAPGRARLDTLVPQLARRDRATCRQKCQRRAAVTARRPAARAQGARGHRLALGLFRAAERERAGAPQAGRAGGARRVPGGADRLASAAARRTAGRVRRAGVPSPRAELEREIGARLAHIWPRTSPNARWKCCASSSAPRFFAWPWRT